MKEDLCPGSRKPDPHVIANKLWPIAAPDACWRPAQDEQICHGIQNVSQIEFPLHLDRREFTAELIQDVQCAECLPIAGSGMHEIHDQTWLQSRTATGCMIHR